MTEGLRTRAAKLAAAARALQAASGASSAPFALAFLTDRRRIARPELILRVLPPGAAVVYRDYDDPRRAARGAALRAIAAARGVLFVVGGDAALARRLGADGLHLRSDDLRRQAAPDARVVSAACHGATDLERANALGAQAAFLSPVFPTASHPDTPALGEEAFRSLAAAARLPVLALGGVEAANAAALAGANVCGLGAIGAFLPG